MNLGGAVLTKHAVEQMARRQIAEVDVRRVLAAPDEIVPLRPGRVVAQGMVAPYLLRVFVDAHVSPAEVVTVYRTSKIEKYRSQP